MQEESQKNYEQQTVGNDGLSNRRKALSSHGDKYEESLLLGCCTMVDTDQRF
jgi:hypothetical protein